MKLLVYLAGVLLVLASCEKIAADNISEVYPTMIIPVAYDTVNINPVHFKWEEVNGATKYRLQVVSPSFASINTFALDSIITGTEFFFPLDSNQYELKLEALNAGYTSKPRTLPFWVGVQPAAGGTNVVLTSPANASYVNASFDRVFSWEPLNGASTYEISIRRGSDFATGDIIDPTNNISTGTYTSGADFTENEYKWGVKAYLTAGGSTDYTIRTLYVDTTQPNQAALGLPANQATETAGVITFTWNNGTDQGTINSPVSSFIEVSGDTGFASIEASATVQGSTTDFDLPAGTFYWRVSNTDEAGNSAVVSEVNQLIVN